MPHLRRLRARYLEEINADLSPTPVTIDSEHPVLLIRIAREFHNGMTDDALYESTRSWWRVNGSRAGKAEWALSVFSGVVRAVYRIDKWERASPQDLAKKPLREGRWGFIGQRDPELEALYLYRDVSGYFVRGNQNPVRYVNC